MIKAQFDRVKNLQSKYGKENDFNIFVYNKKWKKTQDEIDVILIGDNPGKKEALKNKFFNGGTKPIIKLIKKNLKKSNLKYLVLNKSNYFTPNTGELETILKSNSHKLSKEINKDIQANAQLVLDICETNPNVEIILFGNIKNTLSIQFLKSFKEIERNKIIYLKHPSFNHLGNQIALQYLKELNEEKPSPNILELFRKLKKMISK